MFTSGPIIDGAGSYWPGSFIVTDPETVPDIIADMKDSGYDAIKVYHNLSVPVYDAIIEAARELDIPVVGHVPTLVGLSHVLESGQQSIEHFTGYSPSSTSEERIKLTLSSGVWLCPTLIVMRSIPKVSDIPELIYVNPDLITDWNTTQKRSIDTTERYQELLKTLYDLGANIIAGTDSGNPYVIAGFSLHDEFQYMQDAGLSPYQVLLTTTVNPAKMLGIEDRVGTIEPGKDADLVLLDENPLLDISNTRLIAGVMTKGFWLSLKDIHDFLKKIAEENSLDY